MSLKLSGTITLYEREDWDARTPGPMTLQGWDAPEAFLHHTDDSPAGLNSFEEQCARMHSYQNYHMDTHGWSDIGYHFVVFPEFTSPGGQEIPARVFQGRLRRYVPAAQEGHNTNTLAVSAVGAGDYRLKRNQRYAVEVLLNRYKTLKTLGGHRDVTATDCPGDGIYRDDLPIIRQATDLARYGS